MPHWDFCCVSCDFVADVSFPSYRVMEQAPPMVCPKDGGQLERRITSDPPGFSVQGFNARNGYAGKEVFKRRFGSIKTEVSGDVRHVRDIV